jgi:hypothetical protein
MNICFVSTSLSVGYLSPAKGQRARAAVNIYNLNKKQTVGMSGQELDDAFIDGLTSLLIDAKILEDF